MTKPNIGIAALASVILVLGLTSCTNPENTGSNVKTSGTAITSKVSKDDKIAAMAPDKYRAKGSFTASVNPDVPPIQFVDSDGNLAGLNPDLLKSAATVMGVKLDLQKGKFDAMVPGLEAKRFDVVASIGDFKERQGKIDFIDYLEAGSAILTSTDFEHDKLRPDQLCGYKIAYARGDAQQGMIKKASKKCVSAGKSKINSHGYGDAGAALLSVKSHQSDAFWGDTPSMLYNVKQSPKLYKIVYRHVLCPYGIGINKDNKQLRDALHAALLKLVDTGVYDQLLSKWGQQGNGMPKLPLNSGPHLES